MSARRTPRAPRREPPGESERDVQARVVQLLELNRWFVLEMDRAAMGKSRHKGAFEVGFPDLVALRDGTALVLELKTRTGKVREAQRAMHVRLAACGVTVHVARSHEDVLALLNRRTHDRLMLATNDTRYTP